MWQRQTEIRFHSKWPLSLWHNQNIRCHRIRRRDGLVAFSSNSEKAVFSCLVCCFMLYIDVNKALGPKNIEDYSISGCL